MSPRRQPAKTLVQQLINAALAGSSAPAGAVATLLTAGILVALGEGKSGDQVRRIVNDLVDVLEGEPRPSAGG